MSGTQKLSISNATPVDGPSSFRLQLSRLRCSGRHQTGVQLLLQRLNPVVLSNGTILSDDKHQHLWKLGLSHLTMVEEGLVVLLHSATRGQLSL